MESPESPALDEAVLEFIGRTVYVQCASDWEGNSDEPDPPKDFEMEIISFWDGDVPRRGGIGRVTTTDHEFTGWSVIFDVRHEGTFDFEKNIGAYNTMVGVDAPDTYRDGWPMFSNAIHSSGGYTLIGRSKTHIQQNAGGNAC